MIKIKYSSGSLIDDDGNCIPVELPAHWEICKRCEGDGTHSDPAIDYFGLTQEDLSYWDEDDFDNYKKGLYDVVCDDCKGEGKVIVVDALDENHPLHDSYQDWLSDKEYEERKHRRNEKARAGYNFDINDDYWD